jgi:hypothetical protein
MNPQMINQIAFLSEWFIALSTDENWVESSCDLVDFLDFVVETPIYLSQNWGWFHYLQLLDHVLLLSP